MKTHTAIVRQSWTLYLAHWFRHLFGISCDTYMIAETSAERFRFFFCLQYKKSSKRNLDLHFVEWEWDLDVEDAKRVVSALEEFIALNEGLKKR